MYLSAMEEIVTEFADLYTPEGIPQQICLKWMLYL